MADDSAYRWNWRALTQGNTRPATRFQETSSTSNLSAVELRMRLAGSTSATADIVLRNGSGITITTATAGAWDFSINAMSAATTDAYTPGVYTYEMDVADSQSPPVVTTILKGEWNLIARIPD